MFERLRMPMTATTVPAHRAGDVGRTLELPPGPALAIAIAQVDVAELADDDLVTYLASTERLAAWAQAAQLSAIDELSHRRQEERLAEGRRVVWSSEDPASLEVAAELRLSRSGAEARVALAESLRRTTDTFRALAHGDLDLAKTRAIVNAVAPLSREAAAAAEARVLGRAPDQTLGQLNQSLRRAVLRVDPESARERAAEVERDRHVSFYPLEHGAAGIWAVGPAPQVQSLYLALTALADKAGGSGATADDRTLAQRRFDVLTDAAYVHLGRDDLPRRQGRRPHLQVTVAATTLLGLDEHPAELAGYGPITADDARRIAADATWTRLLTDPATGMVVDYGTTRYRPPQSLVDLVTSNQPTCRGLGCRQPASRCEIDHTIEFPRGPTALHNLGPRCTYCHHHKHHGRWEVAQLASGTHLYTSPAGRHYRRDPDPPLEPVDIPPF